ncbi:MAG: hypothetical protein QM723_13940 [Myxococcaceae bacterium]
MQPRFATHASPAASFSTTSLATPPDGYLKVASEMNGGTSFGARF